MDIAVNFDFLEFAIRAAHFHAGFEHDRPAADPFCETPYAETMLAALIARWIELNVDFDAIPYGTDSVVLAVHTRVVSKKPDGFREEEFYNDADPVAPLLADFDLKTALEN
ncbi:hypothetical protein [Magnetospirillum molischianum]|uniref:Uncharacterized protein n=1 Tax=Magnetospirillum molischianum DSM 120 TaxID=1150626 RepID=H8FXY1_MAGML|nr:hypothetical protein [Magnetospirillum molischianum]CCG43219.1 hypothetical protein PHAMO_80010 [Magnetospirillum molischianum DSM 120]